MLNLSFTTTDSGKTHKMRGSPTEPGVIPLAVHDLFESISLVHLITFLTICVSMFVKWFSLDLGLFVENFFIRGTTVFPFLWFTTRMQAGSLFYVYVVP